MLIVALIIPQAGMAANGGAVDSAAAVSDAQVSVEGTDASAQNALENTGGGGGSII
jgi:hypothetical protein